MEFSLILFKQLGVLTRIVRFMSSIVYYSSVKILNLIQILSAIEHKLFSRMCKKRDETNNRLRATCVNIINVFNHG